MTRLTEADQYLLDGIRRGDEPSWTELVRRYQGRLHAFARRHGNPDDAEDIVQETFLSFLRSADRFRGEASLETFLFTILRRRIADRLRAPAPTACATGRPREGADDSSAQPADPVAPQHTASWYARRDESYEAHDEALRHALDELVERLRGLPDLKNLQIVEGIFYGQLRNKEIAEALDVSENRVAQIRFRCLRQIAQKARPHLGSGSGTSSGTGAAGEALWDSPHSLQGMLTDAWEQQRLSCPKRSTLGRYLLGTLEEPWAGHVRFHVERLGCRFCEASLDDLRRQSRSDVPDQAALDRVLRSTVGFLRGG